MHIYTSVYERDIENQKVETFRDGVKLLAMDLLSQYDEDPFDDDIIEAIKAMDFSSDITYEVWAKDGGFSVYKLKNYEQAIAWSSHNGNYDGKIEEVN